MQQLDCYANSTICNIACNDSVSCFGSTFTINSAISNVICESNFACSNVIIKADNIDNHTKSSINILCNYESSCVQANIRINSYHTFILDCVEKRSCAEITINVTNSINGTIRCY